ncbi:MAG: C39 family peptidase [Actinomycetota bacterium]|nr:C39 family peptidase [Actinomycetota bacterium]
MDDLSDSMSFDTDDDGFAETTVLDTDGDGLADAAVFEDEATGDTMLYMDVDGDGDVDPLPDEPEAAAAADPEPPIDDGVHGDPLDDIVYHQAQPGPVACVPTSIAMVLSELSGETVAADLVVTRAEEMNVLTPTGMSPEDGVRLLEDFDVDAKLERGEVDDLRAALDAGHNVIVGLDATDLYAGGGGFTDPGMQTGHAVVITGIDDNTGAVYINDPGFPDGAGVQIALAAFEDAWADSDHAMITANPEPSERGAGGAAYAIAVAALILLPLTLTVRPPP